MALAARRARIWGITMMVAAGALALPAAGAQAASTITDCAHLQAALDSVHAGDVIILDQLCTAGDSGSSDGTFVLGSGPRQPSYTVEGKPGSGAGFDGASTNTSILQASGAAHPTMFTIRNLSFRNAVASASPGGGAIALDGVYELELEGDSFAHNRLAGTGSGAGGAVQLTTSATTGSIAIRNSVFAGNSAASRGGAVDIAETGDGGVPVSLIHDRFMGNQVQGAAGTVGTLAGGALSVELLQSGLPALRQSWNTFTGNLVTGGAGDAYGGAESMVGLRLISTGDAFTENSIQAPSAGRSSGGAALSIANPACAGPRPMSPHQVARDLVIAGNSIADGSPNPDSAEGAVYAGCGRVSPDSSTLRLVNVTISGNRGGGGTGGIWAEAGDRLALVNSILEGNQDGVNLQGFGGAGSGGRLTARFSDLCRASAPYPGRGNICAHPRLARPASGNVHETAASPTINAGSNLLVPLDLTRDVFGKPRMGPRYRRGSPRVDMGAAELPPRRR